MLDKQPLQGVKVISMAEQYPGPYATLLLADLGADVILVERQGGGDPSRQFPVFHESLNRNKRSLALDLKAPEGREAFLRVAADADVILEGFRPGVVDRLGVGYDDVCEVKPDIVYVSISGFGQQGPLKDRPAHDLSYLAIAGMLHEQLSEGADPLPSVAIGDLSSGMFAVIAILTGLVARDRTGEGSAIDVSMTDGLISWMTTFLYAAANGFGHPGIPSREPGYGVFDTADGGVISLSVAHEDWFWQRLCVALELDELGNLVAAERRDRHDDLRDRIAAVLATQDRVTWEARLDEAGVPFGSVHSLDEVLDHPHTRERGLLVDVPADDGHVARRHVRQPLVFGSVPTPIERHVPDVGQDTVEILRSAGFTSDDVASLLDRGIAG